MGCGAAASSGRWLLAADLKAAGFSPEELKAAGILQRSSEPLVLPLESCSCVLMPMT